MPSLVLDPIPMEDHADYSAEPLLPSSSTPSKATDCTSVCDDADEDCKSRPSITPPTDKKASSEQSAKKSKKQSLLKNQKSIASFFGATKAAILNPTPPHTKRDLQQACFPEKPAFEPPTEPSHPVDMAKEALRDIVVGVCAPLAVGKKSSTPVPKSLPLPRDIWSPLRPVSRFNDEVSVSEVAATAENASHFKEGVEPVIGVARPTQSDADDDTTVIMNDVDDEATTDKDAIDCFDEMQVEDAFVDIEMLSAAHTTHVEALSVNIPPTTILDKVHPEQKKTSLFLASVSEPPNANQKHEVVKAETSKSFTSHETPVISPDRAAFMATNELLRQKYLEKSAKLMKKGKEGVSEENFQIPKPDEPPVMELSDGSFPEVGVAMLASLLQESRLPLSALANEAIGQLQKSFPKLAIECVTEKIKVLATRESYIKGLPGQMTQNKTNIFEDTDATRMWRWEVIILELLPDVVIPNIRRARMARRKLRSHSTAIGKLLASLDVADKLLVDDNSTKEKCDAIITRISNDEEKVLKFEREAEKARLLEVTKTRRSIVKMVEEGSTHTAGVANKHVERETKLEQKKKEKEQQENDRIKKKEETRKLKDEAKVKKQLEREEKGTKATLEKQQSREKNKARMMSFFSSSVAEPNKPLMDKVAVVPVGANSTSTYEDMSKFWSLIDSSSEPFKINPLFATLSATAKRSRRRHTRKVTVDVYVTVMPDDPFSAQPFADLQSIQVPNKYKFLSFEEDYRPAYHGTWSKESKIINGRNPFGKDTTFLNYDLDSEEEWEEGDDEIGEDLEANDNDDEEDNVDPDEGDTRAYNFEDGWMADDDDVIYEDGIVDEEAKLLRKSVLKEIENKVEQSSLCLMSPVEGGLPLADHRNESEGVEGVFDAQTAFDLEMLNTVEEIELDDEISFLDVEFPPELVEEISATVDDTSALTSPKAISTQPEMSREQIRDFACFVHHCKLSSKDQLVEQLRIAHPTVTSSRAQATRKLDSIAVKQRNPRGGTVWVVNEEILKELALDDLLQMELEEPVIKEIKASKKPTMLESTEGCNQNATTAIITAAKEESAKEEPTIESWTAIEGLGERTKAEKSAEMNPTKEAGIYPPKVAFNMATAPVTSRLVGNKISEGALNDEKNRKRTLSFGSAQLFAAFLAGKKVKTASES